MLSSLTILAAGDYHCVLSGGSACYSALPGCLCWPHLNHSSVQFSRSVMSNSLRPHGLQHTRVSCPSSTPIAQPVVKLPEWVSATHGLRSSVEFKPPVNSCKYIHCQKAKCQLFHLTWTATREQPIGILLGFLSIPRELHSSEIIPRK